MKKLFKILSVLISLLLTFNSYGCNWSTDDTTKIIDAALEKYNSLNNTTEGTYSQFKDINIASSYLGYGYDVINTSYMDKNKIDLSAPIIDINKIDDMNLKLVKENSSSFDEYSGETMQEFSQNYSTKLNLYGKFGNCFSGGLKTDYNGSITEKTYWKFYKYVYTVKTYNLYITDNIAIIRNLLSAEFKNDITSLSPELLFDKYGTHLIKEVAMGGRMEISATYSSTTSKKSTLVETAVNSHIKYLNSSINVETDSNYSNELENAKIKCNVQIKQFGGKLIDTHSVDSVSSNLSSWISSFEEKLDYSALSGIVGDNSLIGLWDLLPENETQRRAELIQKYNEMSENSYKNLCDSFKLKDSSLNEKIKIDTPHITLKNDEKYNPNSIITNTTILSIHDDWELGNLYLYGCTLKDDKYNLNNPYDFAIKYNLIQEPNNLPKSIVLQADTAKGVLGTNIVDTVKKGAFWVRITYVDDTQSQVNATNIFDDKHNGDFITFIDSNNIDDSLKITRIDITFVYQLKKGIYQPNIRCDKTIYFN